MVSTRFGLSRPESGSVITLHEARRCLVACKGGLWGVSCFEGIWGEKSLKKRSVHSGPKDASSAYLFWLGSPSWYPFRVPTSVYKEIIGRGWDAGHPPPPTPPTPPPLPTQFWPGHISGPSIQNEKNPSSPVSLSTLVIGSSLKIFDETASFWRISIFLRSWAFWGSGYLCFFRGPPNGQTSQKITQIFRGPKSCAR